MCISARTNRPVRPSPASSATRRTKADPTEKAKLKAEFKAQTKIGSLFGYAMHKLNSQYDQNGDKIGG